MNDLVVITGQTATGKTQLALNVAKERDGEIINADSRQVYKYLDIVTGKDKDELKKSGIKVHLLDVATPDQSFSSYDFVTAAVPFIQDIWRRKKTPIIVGGSYLYIKHLLYGQDTNVPPNQKLRAKLEKKTVSELQEILFRLFNQSKQKTKMNNSDWHNPRRLIRRIEIATYMDKSIKSENSSTDAVEEQSGKTAVVEWGKIKIIGLKHRDRTSLVQAITTRVANRIKEGAIQEVEKLLAMGFKKTAPGLQTIGYKQLITHLEGDRTLEEVKQDWTNKEVQYAKRQLTFMKLDPKIEWREV